MRIAAFIMSACFAVFGVGMIALGLLVQAVLPKFGRIAFQAAARGEFSENDYYLNINAYYIIAAACMIGGLVSSGTLYGQAGKHIHRA